MPYLLGTFITKLFKLLNVVAQVTAEEVNVNTKHDKQ